MPLCRGWTVVEASTADVPLGLLDHGGRQLFQGLSRPHRVDLNLGRALDVVKPIIGVGDRLADRADAVIGHEQHGLVADDLGEAIAFLGLESRAGVLVVVGNFIHHPDLGLANLLDARVLEACKRARIRHVRVKHGFGLRQRLVDRRMDAEAGAFHLARAAPDLAVFDADLHEGRGRHLRPMHPEWDLVIAVAVARHDQRKMVENSLAETVHEGQPVRSRQIDTRLPFLGIAIAELFRRNPELHGHPPCCVRITALTECLDGLLIPVF